MSTDEGKKGGTVSKWLLTSTLGCGARLACLVGKSWDFQVRTALGVELDENLAMIRDSVGLAASRLTDRFQRPSLIFSYDESAGEATGSARSVPISGNGATGSSSASPTTRPRRTPRA